MNQDADWPEFPRFMIAAARKVSTIRSPNDGQHGLAVSWTKSPAKKAARHTPGTAVIVEATPEMFLEAIKEAHNGSISGPNSVTAWTSSVCGWR